MTKFVDRLFRNVRMHASDQSLGRLLSGELPDRKMLKTQKHLQRCWQCRSRYERMDRAALRFVDFHNAIVESDAPPSSRHRELLARRMEQVELEMARPPWRPEAVARLRFAAAHWRPAAIALAFFVLATAGIVVLFHQGVTTVSASEILHRAQLSEQQMLRSASKPVVHQKLRIRSGSSTVTQTVYHDAIGNRWKTQWEGDFPSSAMTSTNHTQSFPAIDVLAVEIQQEFVAAQWDWRSPLSSEAFNSWRDRLKQKRDEVFREDDSSLSLSTKTSEGPVAEVRLQVRASDFHPIAETIRLQDNRQIEITELLFEILNLDSIAETVFPSGPVKAGFEASVAPPVTAASPLPSEAELAESELQARIILHGVNADLGEQIEIDRTKRVVEVRGVVENDWRKEQIAGVLHGIQNVAVEIQTVGEARKITQKQEGPTRDTAGPPSIEGRSSPPAAELSDQVISDKLPIQDYLQKYFIAQVQAKSSTGNEKPAVSVNEVQREIQGFSTTALKLSEAAFAEAWALRRLTRRYTPEEITRLSPQSRRELEDLIRDHVRALKKEIEKSRNTVTPILSAIPQPDGQGSKLRPDEKPMELTWPECSAALFNLVNYLDRLTNVLFAGAGLPVEETVVRPSKGPLRLKPSEEYVADLLLLYSLLEDQLPRLEKSLSGRFIENP